MGSGDEIGLRFDTRALPPLPSGWRRDFLLLVGGWAKDADANTAFSQTVLPLPFHGMSSYPYPPNEHYPQDESHQRVPASLQHTPGAEADPLAGDGGPREHAMKRYVPYALGILIVNSAYLAAFAQASIFYEANVLLHLGLGLVLAGFALKWARKLSAGMRRFRGGRGSRRLPRGGRQHHAAPLGALAAHRPGAHRRRPDRMARGRGRPLSRSLCRVCRGAGAASRLHGRMAPRASRPRSLHRQSHQPAAFHGPGRRRRTVALRAVLRADQHRQHHSLQLLHGFGDLRPVP